MNDNTITKINKNAFNDLTHLEGINQNKETNELQVKISFTSYTDQLTALDGLLKVISHISYEAMDKKDNEETAMIYELSNLAKQLVPAKEGEFLDELIFERGFANENFTELNKI